MAEQWVKMTPEEATLVLGVALNKVQIAKNGGGLRTINSISVDLEDELDQLGFALVKKAWQD